MVAGLGLAYALVPRAVPDIADVELAVGALHEAVRPGDDHAADRVGTAGVRVVVDLDPFRRRLQTEHLRHSLQQPALRGALGHPPAERLAGVQGRVLDQLALRAALRYQQLDLALRTGRKRLGDQLGFRNGVRQQDQPRRRLVVVELSETCSPDGAVLGITVLAG